MGLGSFESLSKLRRSLIRAPMHFLMHLGVQKNYLGMGPDPQKWVFGRHLSQSSTPMVHGTLKLPHLPPALPALGPRPDFFVEKLRSL